MVRNSLFVALIFITHKPCREKNRHSYRESQNKVVPSHRMRTMSDKEVKEFMAKLDAGLKLAEKRMLQEKALRNETVVMYSEKDGIQYIPAKQVISENAMFQ